MKRLPERARAQFPGRPWQACARRMLASIYVHGCPNRRAARTLHVQPKPHRNWKVKDREDRFVRVEVACQAIHQHRVQKGHTRTAEERKELDDALRVLFTLMQRAA